MIDLTGRRHRGEIPVLRRPTLLQEVNAKQKIGALWAVGEAAREKPAGCRRYQLLEAAEEFVEFVGGVEVRFQFAGVEAFAEVIESASQQIQGGGEDFAIG
jgi:hypothetical protein